MTDGMRYAVRCVATYVQVLSHAVGHAFACSCMRVCALFVALRLWVEKNILLPHETRRRSRRVAPTGGCVRHIQLPPFGRVGVGCGVVVYLESIINIITKTDKESFCEAFNEWYEKYRDVINERVHDKRIKRITPPYMRSKLRSAYLSIKRYRFENQGSRSSRN